MKRMRAVGLAAVVAWAGFYPTHAQYARVNGTPRMMGAAAQNPNPARDDKAVANGAPNTVVAQNPPKRSLGGAPSSFGKRPMTFADLMAMKRVSDPQISPSGRWVLFTVMDVDLGKNTKTNHLWVVPLGTDGAMEAHSSSATPLGNDDSTKTNTGVLRSAQDDGGIGGERQATFGAGESFGRFSPDGRWVSWTQEPGKDGTFARIVVAAWDEKAGTVGAGTPLTGISGDADGAVWSPDSRRLMLTTEVWPECSVVGGATPTSLRDVGHPSANAGVLRSAQDDGSVGGIEISGTRDVAAWKTMQPASWAEEDACDKAKDEAAEKNPVKAQVWDGLLYRHWDHWTGAKRTHILVMDADGRNIRDITTARDVGDAETPTWMLGGPQEYAWSPDSKEIAYVTNLDAVPAASTNNDVFTLRLDEAEARPVKVSTSPGSDDEPEYSPDGRWLAFRSQGQAGFESDRFRLMLSERCGGNRDQGTGNRGCGREWTEPKELMPKFDRWIDEFTWAPDSNAIYFAAGDAGHTLVAKASLEGSQERPFQPILKEHEYSELQVSPDGKVLIASQTAIDEPTDITAVEMTRMVTVQSYVRSTAAQKEFDDQQSFSIAPTPSHVEHPAYQRPLTHLNDRLLHELGFSESFFSNLHTFRFAGAGGTSVQGFLVEPPGFDENKKYPVKFLMHGGPQTAWGDAWSYRWNWELMAASGYVVIGINRRGSTGYGQKFVDEVSGDWGGRAYEDLMKGLDYAEANFPFIDKTRECALGASYGGYMADWVLTHTNRFKCIVTHDGMYDAGAAWGTTEEMWFNEWEFRRPEDFPKGWDGFGGGYNPMRSSLKANTGVLRSAQDDGGSGDNPTSLRDVGRPATATTNAGVPRLAPLARDDGGSGGATPTSQNRDVGHPSGDGHAAEPWRYAGLPASEDPFRRWSPKEYIQNARTPTLIIHSQRDYRLDVSQGFALYTALQRLGVPSRFLYFPDEGHWVLKPKNSELWNAVVSDWCDRWTHTGKYAEK